LSVTSAEDFHVEDGYVVLHDADDPARTYSFNIEALEHVVGEFRKKQGRHNDSLPVHQYTMSTKSFKRDEDWRESYVSSQGGPWYSGLRAEQNRIVRKYFKVTVEELP
jgi:hypothetical protein